MVLLQINAPINSPVFAIRSKVGVGANKVVREWLYEIGVSAPVITSGAQKRNPQLTNRSLYQGYPGNVDHQIRLARTLT